MKPDTQAEIDFCALVAHEAAKRGITLERATHLFGVLCGKMVTHDMQRLGHDKQAAVLKYINTFLVGMGAVNVEAVVDPRSERPEGRKH